MGTTGAADYQLSNAPSNSRSHADTTIPRLLSPLAPPKVNMLQGIYIWMYVEHKDGTAWGEEGRQWKERRMKTQGKQSEGKNRNVT